MRVVECFSFNDGIEKLGRHDPKALTEIKGIIAGVDVSDCKDKPSRERGRAGLLYSPVKMNVRFKATFQGNGWDTGKRIPARYKSLEALTEKANVAIGAIHAALSAGGITKREVEAAVTEATRGLDPNDVKLYAAGTIFERLKEEGLLTTSGGQTTRSRKYDLAEATSVVDLANIITPDFVGYREIDAIKNRIGLEVQFGKYAFMVYNVCAKMTIFHKKGKHENGAETGLIDYGVEIVPVKSLQREMSTGVAFFEQFVWDLEQRGHSNIDIPVVIIGIGL